MTAAKNLLLIDDDEIFTFMTRKLIEKTRLADRINIFGNGQDAIEFLERTAHQIELLPEVIFLDLAMPVLDGWGFLDEYMRVKPKLGKKIMLYVVTSSVSPHDFERAKNNSEVSDFIVKPISKEKFIDIIGNLSA